MDRFEKMMGKKKKEGSEMPEMVKKTKMGILENLRDQADDMMSDKVANLKKVTVASGSKEGLGMGLEKAKELLEGQQNDDDSSEDDEQMDMGPGADMMEKLNPSHEHEEMDEDAINQKLEELMKMKERLASKKM